MDDVELRMKLSDLGGPEALADCIIKHFPEMEIPIPLSRIAEAVGIVDIISQKTDAFEGVLITDGSKTKGSIAYNESSRPQRRRFTIAHELGHFLLPLHGANAQCAKADMSIGHFTSKDSNRAREAEANLFAASLLMPRAMFLSAIRRLGAPEVGHIVKLADDYGVSKEACVHRYTDLCDDPCAVIFSRHGIVRYICKTKDFPFIDLRKDQPLPRQSISAQMKYESGQTSDQIETIPEIWTNDCRRLRDKVLYEQSLDQTDGYRLSMLTIDGALEDDDDPDEDEEMEESWVPKFRR
jgi:Zn-dependent peptidase ImmA (M78 family)